MSELTAEATTFYDEIFAEESAPTPASFLALSFDMSLLVHSLVESEVLTAQDRMIVGFLMDAANASFQIAAALSYRGGYISLPTPPEEILRPRMVRGSRVVAHVRAFAKKLEANGFKVQVTETGTFVEIVWDISDEDVEKGRVTAEARLAEMVEADKNKAE